MIPTLDTIAKLKQRAEFAFNKYAMTDGKALKEWQKHLKCAKNYNMALTRYEQIKHK
jgi:hypothetical protein